MRASASPEPRRSDSRTRPGGLPRARHAPGRADARRAAAEPRRAAANSDAERRRPAPAARRRGRAVLTTIATPTTHEERAEHPRGGEVGPVHGSNPMLGYASAFLEIAEESMITRQGRSASTVSSVRPKVDEPARSRRQRHHHRGRLDLACASRTIRRPASPGAHLLEVPGHAPPAAHRAESIAACAFASASGIDASIGALAGTVIVTSTWMPRRRRAASFTAVETASARVLAVLEGHQHRLVLHLVLDDRLGHHDLRSSRSGSGPAVAGRRT